MGASSREPGAWIREVLTCTPAVVSGYGAVVGPKEVSGFEGDTVSLQCSYGEERRTFRKYWCRIGGIFISRCSGRVYAGGDSQEGRVSVRDRRKELRFTVTLRNLTLQDAGQYWCGVQRLGFDETFLVSLLVFPGPCCPSSPSPSFQPLTTTRLQPKAKAWQTQPPELTSPGLHPRVTAAKQGETEPKALPSTGASWYVHAASSPARASPHAATSPHAGIAYPATQLHATSTKGPGPRSSSSSSSRPRVSIPIARILAPVLILLALLLATALAALGSHVLCRRKEGALRGSLSVPLAKETERSEKVDFAHSPPGNSWVPEYTVINLAGTSGPPLSPQPSASAYKDIQLLSQTSVEEEVPQDPEGDRIPVPPAPGSGEEPGLPKLTSV
ncbi:CMRF35-like molecule 9 isoform X5 [Dasypus novemcinctus]|uniref:CMRF35-like molecule 9 isoform X5 n=1 Tax=Dasypus novemcinctus TaxID=9361 RepID=UPI0039C9B232